LGAGLAVAAGIDHGENHHSPTRTTPRPRAFRGTDAKEFPISQVDEGEKQALLGAARALLFPIDWPEPFGLVMIEAMACGTPVIARPKGAAPEVIVDGVTGILAERHDDLAAAVEAVRRLERAACRHHVESNFSVEKMVDAYEGIYEARSIRKVKRASSSIA
jgi:glycosyltransferase involved in cell wall biosynthesis